MDKSILTRNEKIQGKLLKEMSKKRPRSLVNNSVLKEKKCRKKKFFLN